jgi:hypothetical protein
MSTITFHAGMRVTSVSSRYPGSGVVTKVNPRTIAVTLDGGQRVRFDRTFLVPEGAEPTPLIAAFGAMSGPPATYVPAPHPGTVVKLSDAMLREYPQCAGLWIVTGGQGDKSRLFRLNNTDGRYWRFPNADLVTVNARLVEAL